MKLNVLIVEILKRVFYLIETIIQKYNLLIGQKKLHINHLNADIFFCQGKKKIKNVITPVLINFVCNISEL